MCRNQMIREKLNSALEEYNFVSSEKFDTMLDASEKAEREGRGELSDSEDENDNEQPSV